jgi:hypothetical protein
MALQERFTTQEAGQMALQERFTTQEAGQMALQERFTTLEAGQTALQYSQTALQDSQTSLRVDTMARMDRLENRLTEIRDDISVNMGSSERAHEAAANTRTELRSLGVQVNVMWRQMKRLEQQVRDITGDP